MLVTSYFHDTKLFSLQSQLVEPAGALGAAAGTALLEPDYKRIRLDSGNGVGAESISARLSRIQSIKAYNAVL